ncbi:ABC transporter permease [Acuticoccus sediminis]|uniref:TRAP transporter large permease protein n=1 Tax=Acuticoccus sediminis TaxID=2184697 RepID=A0A8B2NNU8_9HYPH|nr:TRAP transporter large permease [Acuticoccus sediminis]RAI00281.1 ABC transporter permease [Acuticoccus sediminis]
MIAAVFLLVGLVVLLLLGVSAGLGIGTASVAYFGFTRGFDSLPFEVITQRLVGTIDSFTLLAIPLFLFVGHMMNESGSASQLFRFANSLVGHWRGGLAQVNVLASMLFAGMSGSGTADAAGLGAMEIKAMREARYDDRTTIGVTVGSALIGPIIPPSIAGILYAVLAGVSPADVLLAGVIPGILMAVSMMALVFFLARRRNLPRETFPGWCSLARDLRSAFLALMTPVILIGGIISGLFTATESAAVAALWAVLISVFAYGGLSFRRFVKVLQRSAFDSAIIMFILACSGLLGWILTRAQLPQAIAEGIASITTSPMLTMLIIIVFALVVGCFMAVAVAINILTPILVPIVVGLGIDPVHFGIVFIMALVIGEATPPFGMVLFVITRVAAVPFDFVVRSAWPFLAAIGVVVLLVWQIPQLALWVPNLVR